MRDVFAHDAVVRMPAEEDLRGPGGAITLALCGSWEHDPPCPLAPHHTDAQRDGDVVRLRVLFAAEPEDEPEVRRRIGEALAGGQVAAPDATVSSWQLLTSEPSSVLPDELDHGRRLAGP